MIVALQNANDFISNFFEEGVEKRERIKSSRNSYVEAEVFHQKKRSKAPFSFKVSTKQQHHDVNEAPDNKSYYFHFVLRHR